MVNKKENVKEIIGDNKPFYDKILRSSNFLNFVSGRANIRVATAMIYERIGDSEYFLGGFPLLKGKYDQIGEYFVLEAPGKNYFVDCLGSDVFTPCKDKKLGKVVEFVKYSDDDYRVRRKLNKKFFDIEQKPLIKYEALKNEDGVVEVDEDNNPLMIPVQEKDDKGNLLFEEVKVKYEEPKGVDQEGRNAIRIHNNTTKEIKKFREQNQSFFEKYGGIIVPIAGLAIVAMVFLFGMKSISDSWSDGVNSLTGEIKDAGENIKWWQQPEALDSIVGAVEKKTDEKNSPPIK